MGADVGGVETERFVSAAEAAGGSNLDEEEGVGDPDSGMSDVDGVDGGGGVPVGDGVVDAGHEGMDALHGAHDRADGAALRLEVHFGAVLLVDKGDSDVFGLGQGTVGR